MKTAYIFAAILLIAGGITVVFMSGGLFTSPDDPTNTPLANNTTTSFPDNPYSEFQNTGELSASPSKYPDFKEVSKQIGINYVNQYEGVDLYSNSGVFVTDYNNDSYTDVLLIGGEDPALFKNTGGEFTRTQQISDITGYIRTAVFVDYDADNDEDLLLFRRGNLPVFFENMNGTFQRQKASSIGLDKRFATPHAVSIADYNKDGCMDLFIAQSGDWAANEPFTVKEAKKVMHNHPDVRPTSTTANKNYLYRGNCNTFTDVTESALQDKQDHHQWSLVTSFTDFTGDGYPDIHVGNDFTGDELYVNQGNGTFVQKDMGVASDRNAMSSEVFDANGDLKPDLFVTNIHYDNKTMSMDETTARYQPAVIKKGNNLFINQNGSNFTDKARQYNVVKGGWGWSAVAADMNNDGYIDIFQGTSNDIPFEGYAPYRPPQIWNGTPVNSEFTDVNALPHGIEDINSRGTSQIDYDNDGDLDLIVSVTSSGWRDGTPKTHFRVYENLGSSNQYLQLRLQSKDIDVGARAYIHTNKRTILRVNNGRTGGLSQESSVLHIGLQNEQLQNVTVVWPNGRQTTYTTLKEGNRYVLTKNSATNATTN